MMRSKTWRMRFRARFQASRADRRERSPCRWRWCRSTWMTPCGQQSKHRLKKIFRNDDRWNFLLLYVAPASELCSASARTRRRELHAHLVIVFSRCCCASQFERSCLRFAVPANGSTPASMRPNCPRRHETKNIT